MSSNCFQLKVKSSKLSSLSYAFVAYLSRLLISEYGAKSNPGRGGQSSVTSVALCGIFFIWLESNSFDGSSPHWAESCEPLRVKAPLGQLFLV